MITRMRIPRAAAAEAARRLTTTSNAERQAGDELFCVCVLRPKSKRAFKTLCRSRLCWEQDRAFVGHVRASSPEDAIAMVAARPQWQTYRYQFVVEGSI